MMSRIKAMLHLLLVTLREIFDENAYARYLARTGGAVSRASYAAFLEERRAAEQRRVRCC
jgi:hypothetical protein